MSNHKIDFFLILTFSEKYKITYYLLGIPCARLHTDFLVLIKSFRQIYRTCYFTHLCELQFCLSQKLMNHDQAKEAQKHNTLQTNNILCIVIVLLVPTYST